MCGKSCTAGLIIVAEPPEFFAQVLKSDYDKYGKLVKAIGLPTSINRNSDPYTRTEVRDGMRITWHQPIAMDDGLVAARRRVPARRARSAAR